MAGQRWYYDIESVFGLSAVGNRIRERRDDFHLLDERPRPAMGDDHRQRILFLRLDVNEMNVQPIDVGDEIRDGVYLRLGFAPVVVGAPIPREFMHRRGLNALRCIVDRFILGPLRRLDAPTQIGKLGFGNTPMKRTYLGPTAGLSYNISRSFRNSPKIGRA